jgi:hypothetical protein
MSVICGSRIAGAEFSAMEQQARCNGQREFCMSLIRYGATCLGLLCASCVSSAPNSALTPPSTPNSQAVAPAGQTGASALSYGTVTSQVVKGKTTQADLLQLFGGPNITTTDNDGVETWVYERSVTQTDAASRDQSWQAAANLSVFFGHGSGGVQAGGGQNAAASSTTTSFRSLTVVVKFSGDKTVKDYSVRASQF